MEELVKYETEGTSVSIWQPVMTIQDMVDRYQTMAQIVKQVMRKDIDYGLVPGSDKPSLHKAGAEKLSTLFGLQKRFDILEKIEDWQGKDHDGEPFFYYLVRCYLSRNGLDIAAMEGSCNSWERKYRYRQSKRVCPTCGSDAIIKGKQEYGGGWVCFAKRGGCGAKFKDGDQSIEGQATGTVVNPDIHDQVNTVLKMAEKRALVATTLVAVGASDFFTQDIEDFIDAEWTEKAPERKPEYTGKITDMQELPTESPTTAHEPLANRAPMNATELLTELRANAEDMIANDADMDRPVTSDMVKWVAGSFSKLAGSDKWRPILLKSIFGVESTKDLQQAQAQSMLDWMGIPDGGYVAADPLCQSEVSTLKAYIIAENDKRKAELAAEKHADGDQLGHILSGDLE